MDNTQTTTTKITFFGLSLIAFAIAIVGLILALNAPFSSNHNCNPHVNVNCNHVRESHFGEFMNDFEASLFLRMDEGRFRELLESGELDGTFHLEVFMAYLPIIPDEILDFDNPNRRPIFEHEFEYEYVEQRRYIFSRSRLIHWMENRIDGE